METTLRRTTSGAGADAGRGRIWPVREGYVDVDGVSIYFKTVGTGRPLLVLHGGPGVSHDYLLQPLLPLARWRHLVVIDQRGCGRAPSPRGRNAYTIDRLVDEIEHVRIGLGLSRIDLLGHSFGGLLAQAYVLAFPDAVAGLLLLATASSIEHVEKDLQRVLCADAVLASSMYASQLPPWDAEALRYGCEAMRKVWGDRSEFRCTGTALALDLEAGMRAWPGRALIVYGDHDIVSDETARHTHQLPGNSRLVRLENAGHEIYSDQPAALLETISSFLDALDHP